jgi:iron complex outermembrane receptor protein
VTLFNDRDLYTARHGSPRSKLILTADWNRGPLGLTVSGTRYGEVSVGTFDDTLPLIEGAKVQKYGADWVADVEGRVSLGGLTVALGSNNLFDQYPAQQASGTNFFGALPYNFYPPVGFNGRYVYSRATYRF